MDKIIIVVRQGLVEAVYSTNPTISVKLLDWDTIDSQNMTDEELQLQNEIKAMKEIL